MHLLSYILKYSELKDELVFPGLITNHWITNIKSEKH